MHLSYGVCSLRNFFVNFDIFQMAVYILPAAIIGDGLWDGDRKSWDLRGPIVWDNFSIFRTNCAIPTSYVHAPVVVSRVDVVTLRDQLLRIARFSSGFFTAIAGNKEPELFYVLLVLLVNERVSFKVENIFDFAL